MRGHWLSTTRKLNNHYQSGTSVSRFGSASEILNFILPGPFGTGANLRWGDSGNLFFHIALRSQNYDDWKIKGDMPLSFIPCCKLTIGNRFYDFTDLTGLPIISDKYEGLFEIRKEKVTFETWKEVYNEYDDITFESLYYNKTVDVNVLYYTGEEKYFWTSVRFDLPTLPVPKFVGKKLYNQQAVGTDYYFDYIDDLYVNYRVEDLFGFTSSGGFFDYNVSYSRITDGPLIQYGEEFLNDILPSYWSEEIKYELRNVGYSNFNPYENFRGGAGSDGGVLTFDDIRFAYLQPHLADFVAPVYTITDNRIEASNFINDDYVPIIYSSNDNFRCFNKNAETFKYYNTLFYTKGVTDFQDINYNFDYKVDWSLSYE